MHQFVISKHEDFFEASVLLAKKEINPSDIKISEDYLFILKIDDPKWGDSNIFDYKKASIILNLQEDILGIHNRITGRKIYVKDLIDHDDLVIKIKVENGCIQYVTKFAEIYEKITKNMTQDQQFICFLLISGVALSGIVCWTAAVMYKKYKGSELELKKKELSIKAKELDLREKERLFDTLDKALVTLSKSASTPRFLSKHVSDLGKVSLGDEELVPKEDIPYIPDYKEKEEIKEITMHIDGVYPVKKYDFETQNLQISIGNRSAWFSTKHMLDEEKEKIREIADRSIISGRSFNEQLQVTATKTEDNKIYGVIIGIGDPRPTAISYIEFLNAKFSDPVRDKVRPLPIRLPK